MYRFLFGAILLCIGISQTHASVSGSSVCTTQYDPVCGFVQVQCITAPCPKVRTDFGNSCMAAAAGATEVT